MQSSKLKPIFGRREEFRPNGPWILQVHFVGKVEHLNLGYWVRLYVSGLIFNNLYFRFSSLKTTSTFALKIIKRVKVQFEIDIRKGK